MTSSRRTVATTLTILLLLAAVHPRAMAGAWVQKKRGYFFKLSGSWLYTTEEFDSDGNTRRIRENDADISGTSYREASITGYLEYGVTGRLTVVANLPFKVVTSRRTEAASPGVPQRDVEAVTGGVSDLTVSGRLHLFGRATPVSIQAGVKLPLGYDPSPPDDGTPLGSGKIDLEGHLLAGASLYPFPGYFTGGAGYRLRKGGGIADEYLYQVEFGLTPGRWLFKVTLDGILSTEPPGDEGSSTTRITNMDVVKLIPTVGYGFTPWFRIGVEAFHTLEGKNTVAGTTWVAGAVFIR